MKHTQLNAEPRSILGKKVKQLRREGLLPANVYGKGLSSTAVQVKTEDFIQIFKEVGETGLVDLMVDGKKHPVLVKNVHFEFRYHAPLHADFYQVNLKEKVKTMVPLNIVGEPKAVAEKLGTLLQTLNEVEVEALPEALPENIEVNVENLAEVNEQVTVGDLKVEEGITILTEGDQVVAKIAEIVEEPEPEAETPEGEEETEAAEGEAGEKTENESGENTENEAKSEEKSE